MRRTLGLLLVACVVTAATGAWGFWSAGSAPGGNGAAASTSVNQGATPSASAAGNVVTVSWAPTTLTTGQAVSGYTVKRYSGSTAQTILTACTGTVAGTSCVESNVPTGVWTYSVTPVFAINWVGVESAKSSTVVVGNVAPVAVANSHSVAEDAVLTVAASGVLGNDSDPNSDPLTAILASGVANGTLSFNANGGFTYTPNPNFNGSDSFSYKANDGTQDSNIVTVTVTVTAVNDAPVNAAPGPQQTPRNTNRVFSAGNNNPVSISDGDAGGATVQVQLTATNGTVTLPVLTNLTFSVGDGTSDATMTFTGTIANINTRLNGATFIPTNNVTGAATLQIVTSDLGSTGSGGTRTDSDTVTINVNSLGIFTTAVDIGGPGLAGSSAYSAGTYTVIGGGADIWANSDQFHYLHRDLTGDGRLTARIVSELPAGTHAGAKTSVMLRESTGAGSIHGTMDLMQTAGTEMLLRTTTGGSTTTTGSSAAVVAPYWVRITRVGNLVTGEYSSNGTSWTIQGTTQTITMGSTIKVGLGVTAHDNTKRLTATYDNVALTTPPTAVGGSYTTNEDTTLSVAAPAGVLWNDTDPESDALTAVLVSGTAGLTLNANGSFDYVPPANFSGAASFTYKANDGVFDSNTVMVNLTVNPANEVPSFTKGANQTVAQSGGAQTIGGWATSISQGTGESGQLVDFVVTNDNNTLFSVQPAVGAAGTLTFTPAGGTGSATVSVRIHDNGGTANAGTDTSAIQTFTITVNAGGARPVVTATVANLSFTENGGAVALDPSITVTDSDSNITGATVSMTTNYVNGQDTLSFSTQNGITGDWVAATGVVTLSGTTTPANYQTALRSITYSNTSDNLVTNNHNVDFVVSDAIGAGNTSSRQVAVSAVNDAPVNTVPAGQTTFRNTAEVFSTGNSNLISITDVDAATVHVQLVSSNGTTTLFGAMPGALTFSAGDGTADATMTFTGTKAAVNTALNGLSFNPTTSFTGAASLQIVTSDLGATGSGGTLTDNDTVAISVVLDLGIFTAQQDIGGPGTAGSSSHSAGTYTVAGGGADIWNNADQFQFLSMPMTGDGRLTAKVDSQTQTPTTSNPAKAGVMFRETLGAGSIHGMADFMKANGSEFHWRLTTSGPSGATTVTPGIAAPYWVRITRVGNLITGERSPDGVTWTQQGASQSIPMTSSIYAGLAVSAVDNAKLNTATFSNVSFEQPPLLAASGGTTAHTENVPVVVDSGITVTDATSANTASGTVTVGSGYTAGQDVLAFTNQAGISGSWSAPTMTLTGSATKAQWQTALRSVTYNNTSNTPNTGNRTINFVVNDGAFNSITAAKTVSVAPANDAPVNSVPAAQTTVMNTAKVFSTGNGNLVSITDVDAAGGTMQVQLVSTNGATTLSSLTGLTFSVGDGTADATMTFTGSFAAVNTALSGLSFNPTAAFTGAASLQIVSADQGNTGTGGTLTDNDTVAITVTSGPSCATEMVTNGGFEGGTGWTQSPAGVVTTGGAVAARSGTWKALLGGQGVDQTESVTQSVTIPSGCTASLSYYLRVTTAETTHPFDWCRVQINGVNVQSYSDSDAGASYVLRTVDLSAYAGQTVTLRFLSDEDASLISTFYLDDVSITSALDYSGAIFGTTGLLNYWRLGESPISSDAMTGTAGATLQSRAGEVGATWTKHSSSNSDAVLTDAGRLRKGAASTGQSLYSASAQPATPNYTVETDIYVRSNLTGDMAGVVGRMDTSNANGTYYVVRYEQEGAKWVLYKRVNGSFDWLGESAQTLAALSTYRLSLDMSDTTIRVLVDGVQQISATDSGISAAGRGGILFGFGAVATTVTNTAGYHLDNFLISPPLTDSEGSNHGDYVGGVATGQTGAISGDANTAALFDGVNDFASVSRTIQDDFSIEFWFKSTQSAGANCTQWWEGRRLVDAEVSGGNSDFGVSLCQGKIIGGIGSTSDVSIVSPLTYNDNAWHHVVFTRTQSPAAMELYVDGASVIAGTPNNTASLTASSTITFGRAPGGGSFYSGLLDEVAVYTTVLSGATISSHYLNGTTP